MSKIIKEQIGDPDQAAIERLTPLTTIADGKPPLPGNRYLSPVLVKEWDDYFNRYCDYYGLSKEPGGKARVEFDKAKDEAGLWLIQGGKDVDKSFSRAEFKAPMSTKERVDDLKKKLAHIHELQDQEIPAFNKDVEKAPPAGRQGRGGAAPQRIACRTEAAAGRSTWPACFLPDKKP